MRREGRLRVIAFDGSRCAESKNLGRLISARARNGLTAASPARVFFLIETSISTELYNLDRCQQVHNTPTTLWTPLVLSYRTQDTLIDQSVLEGM